MLVYLHVYGATVIRKLTSYLLLVLSPCVWGHLTSFLSDIIDLGSIPMCMGPPLAPYDRRGLWRVYPHVYGATNASFSSTFRPEGLSPCVWGHHTCPHSRRVGFGSIPMCMGPPASIRILRKCRRVYPHVYGATTSIQSSMGMGQGLSPCVWGHHIENDAWTGNKGSIPMCMGPPVGMWYDYKL